VTAWEQERGTTGSALANEMTRRWLLRSTFWATLVGGGAAAMLGAARFLQVPPRLDPLVVRLPMSALPRPGDPPLLIRQGRPFFLVHLRPGDGLPSGLTCCPGSSGAEAARTGGVLAMAAKCTHSGCALPWRPDFWFERVQGWFRCPCHGSTFTTAGLRVFGPAPRPLDTLDVTYQPGRIVQIHTGRIRMGGPDNAQRASQPPGRLP
jgi:cytochrome b6-f complex iron-sulfur subunit